MAIAASEQQAGVENSRLKLKPLDGWKEAVGFALELTDGQIWAWPPRTMTHCFSSEIKMFSKHKNFFSAILRCHVRSFDRIKSVPKYARTFKLQYNVSVFQSGAGDIAKDTSESHFVD